MIHYTVYRTTNNLTSRFYIGVHKTANPNDKYLGSGIWIKASIKKHGRKAFTKEVLFKFDTAEEAYAKEDELVTPELLASGMTYNIARGGVPSIDWPLGARKLSALRGAEHPMWGRHDPVANAQRSASLKEAYRLNPRDPSCWEKTAAKRRGGTTSLKGRPQSDELKAKRAEAMKNIPKVACAECGKLISPSNLKNHARVHSA